MMSAPPTRRTELVSYTGERVTCELTAPRDAAELAAVFAYCRGAGRAATLRASGLSFDGQALNRDLVVSLEHFTGLRVDPEGARAHAGAATRWGDVVEQAVAAGCFPSMVVTTPRVSVGGTLASNSYTRFTPVRGKEIEHVGALELVAPSGETFTCARDRDPELFAGVVGGFGYLAAVASAEN